MRIRSQRADRIPLGGCRAEVTEPVSVGDERAGPKVERWVVAARYPQMGWPHAERGRRPWTIIPLHLLRHGGTAPHDARSPRRCGDSSPWSSSHPSRVHSPWTRSSPAHSSQRGGTRATDAHPPRPPRVEDDPQQQSIAHACLPQAWTRAFARRI